MALTVFQGAGYSEDLPSMVRRQPFMTPFWAEKEPAVERIDVPTYVVSSYTNKVHTSGTIHGFNRVGSAEKWLRIHNSHECRDFRDHQGDLARFFDRYLKDVDNGWETTPRVRMAILDPDGEDTVDRPEESFPPANVVLRRYALDARDGSMSTAEPDAPAVAECDATAEDGSTAFTLRFDRDTELVGYPWARLAVSATAGEDIDVYLRAEKLDADGRPIELLIHGVPYSGKHGAPYECGNGQIRASHRALDPDRTTEAVPYLSDDRPQPITPGEVVMLDIELPPMGMCFRTDQQLRLTISGHSLKAPEFTFLIGEPSVNEGRTRIHTGGEHASFLQLPKR